MIGKAGSAVAPAFLILACAAAGYFIGNGAEAPTDRTFHVVARKYAFDPPIIHVNRGDRITVYLTSLDVTHGFYLEGYDIDAKISPDEKPQFRHPSEGPGFKEVECIQFVADKTGKFRYRCSCTCGFMHPFMMGEMVVAPNHPFAVGLGAAVGLLLAMIMVGAGKTGVGKAGETYA